MALHSQFFFLLYIIFVSAWVDLCQSTSIELYEYSVVKSHKKILSFFFEVGPTPFVQNNIWRSVCFWCIQRVSLLLSTPSVFPTVIFAYNFFLYSQFSKWFILRDKSIENLFQIYYIFVIFCVHVLHTFIYTCRLCVRSST